MKLDNFVPYGRQQSGTVIIEFTTKLDVSDKYILEQQYHSRLENKAMHLFLRLHIFAFLCFFEVEVILEV